MAGFDQEFTNQPDSRGDPPADGEDGRLLFGQIFRTAVSYKEATFALHHLDSSALFLWPRYKPLALLLGRPFYRIRNILMGPDDLTIGLQGIKRVTQAFVTDKSGIRTNPRRTFYIYS